MDITFSPLEQQFRAECRDWLQGNVPAERRPLNAIDALDLDRQLQRRMFDAGWGGINWPAKYGGRGLSLIEQVIWVEGRDVHARL